MDPATSVVFLLDAAKGVTPQLFLREKKFLKSLIDLLKISPKGPRGIVVKYGENAETISNFLQKNIKQNIDRSTLLQTPRRIDTVLQHAFQILKYSRSKGPNIVVLLTTGEHTKQPDAIPVHDAVELLRDIGSEVYVVAMGEKTKTESLMELVSSPRYILRVPSSSDLLPRAKHLSDSSKIYRSFF